MKIVVTGMEGYIGSLLAPMLMNRGHEVLGVDTGFYKAGWLYNGAGNGARTINKDVRLVSPEDLSGYDAVVHLAELSNDPAGQLSPAVTHDINHRGSVRLATNAKAARVERFIYASSCSVYGLANGDNLTETSPVNPQTTYGLCKTLVERDVRTLADENFSPTFLRNATVFGASPRMRFDIVLNNLSGLAWTTKEIKMVSDGTPWRPLVHISDVCKAIVCSLEASRDVVHNQTFNVGNTSLNYRVKEIAEIVAESFPGCKLSLGATCPDNRSYRVSFEKINSKLPGFGCEWDARRGARQLFDLFSQVDLSRETFEFRGYTRLKQLEYLLRTRQIDKNFFWRERTVRPASVLTTDRVLSSRPVVHRYKDDLY